MTDQTIPGMPPTLLFGAFDRHNFGDLLFPHIASLLPGRELRFAVLANRDLLHVGGELLASNLREAAVLRLAARLRATVARPDSHRSGHRLR